METLNMIMVLLIAVGLSAVIYRFIVSKQRLEYDSKINTELIVSGFLLNTLIRLLRIVFESVVFPMGGIILSSGQYWIFNGVYSIIFVGLFFILLYKRLLKPEHYINKYDISIYTLCVGIGMGISNIIILTVFEEGLSSALYLLSSLLMPLTILMIMAFFITLWIEDKKLYLLWSFIIPSLVVFIDSQFYIIETFLGVFSKLSFEVLIYSLLSFLFVNSIRGNVEFDNVDVEQQLDRFENEKTLREKISYRFDSFMSYGKLAITGILFVIGMIVVIVVAIIILVETPEVVNGSLTKTLWLSFMRVLDPGNVATDPDFNNGKFVVITTIATFIGLALISTYIGMVSGDFSARIEKLREGNSKVLEKNHILMIGFCEDTLSIIDYLMKFKSNKEALSIVIVSGQSRKDVEERIAGYGIIHNKTSIICRNGDLESRTTLANMGITRASTVVILGDHKEETLRISMTVNSLLKIERYQSTDILMMADTEEDLHLSKNIFGDRMKVFSRQELDFDLVVRAGELKEYLKLYGSLTGVEGSLVISLQHVKKCVGKTFGEIINSFKYSCVIGLEKNREIVLNPEKDLIIDSEHKLIMLTSSNIRPDYTGKDKKFDPLMVTKTQTIEFVQESVETVLIIGDRHYEAFSSDMRSKNPGVKQINVDFASSDELLMNIDRVMSETPPDIVTVLGFTRLEDEKNDDQILKILAYIDAKYYRKKENYVVAALIDSVQDIKFAYELDYIDMVIENDKCRRMALEVLENKNMITQVEEQLFETGERVGAVLAEQIVGIEQISVIDVYRACALHNLVLIGYIKREGGIINIEINPNKNEKVIFDDDDLLLVLK